MIRLFVPVLLISLLGACSTPQKKQESPLPRACPQAQIELRNGTEWGEDDAVRISGMVRGCKVRYGEDSCLIRVTKTGVAQYRVICKSLSRIP